MRKMNLVLCGGMLCAGLFSLSNLWAETYSVTYTKDSGAGSLRQAIEDANVHPGPDLIVFHLPKSDAGYLPSKGTWTIRPTSALPEIVNAGLTIDGSSQAEFIGADTNPDGPEIVVSGALIPYLYGFCVQADSVHLWELVIQQFTDTNAVWFKRAKEGSVCGCYIGTDETGMVRAANFIGIALSRHSDKVQIKPRNNKPNIISGNWYKGIAIQDSCCYNTIQGNIIGLNRTRQDTLGNGSNDYYGGIFISFRSDSNQIIDNYICGNRQHGIMIHQSSGNIIANNFIGTNQEWSQALGNYFIGIYITADSPVSASTAGNQIIHNHIGHNGYAGVAVQQAEAQRNLISENSISKNGELGIWLMDGANNHKASCQLESVFQSRITGKSQPGDRVEIFSDPQNQGKVFLGVAMADADGAFSLQLSTPLPYDNLTATATDELGNTSTFCRPFTVTTAVTDHVDRNDDFQLLQSFPNPFNLTCSIKYRVKERCRVFLSIFDLEGHRLIDLVDSEREPGWYRETVDAGGFPSGIYFYRIKMQGYSAVRKMILAK